MAEPEPSGHVSQARFAERLGVSRKTVTTWKNSGLLVMTPAGKVDVEASLARLRDRPATYRGGVTTSIDPVTGCVDPVTPSGVEAEPGNSDAAASKPPDPADFDLDDPNLPMAEAVRRKENFLGLQRKHELEVLRKEWVRVEDVGAEVDRANAVVRGRLLAIPGKLAANLVGLDLQAIRLALDNEIREALSELHAPAAGGGRD